MNVLLSLLLGQSSLLETNVVALFGSRMINKVAEVILMVASGFPIFLNKIENYEIFIKSRQLSNLLNL